MAKPRIPRSNGQYSYSVVAAKTKGYWSYMIYGPDGAEHCAGRRSGNKADCENHCAKILHRFNDTQRGWTPLKLPKTRTKVAT